MTKMGLSGKITFVIGASGSGKSRFAEGLVGSISGKEVVYVATCRTEGLSEDAEMMLRIEKHRKQRPSEWFTYENQMDLEVIAEACSGKVVLLDCLTLWLSDAMSGEVRSMDAILENLQAGVDAMRSAGVDLVVVSNEVGAGIVPIGQGLREYRDLVGKGNQLLAAASEDVYWGRCRDSGANQKEWKTMRPKHGGELESEPWPLETNGWLDFSVNLNPFAEFLSEQEWLNARKLIFQYPPPTSQSLDSIIAAYLGLSDTQQVIATRGGMEALRFALQNHRGKTVHIPTPCFSEYIYLCEQLGMDYRLHSVAESDWCDPTAWLSFSLEPGSVWFFGNPNNPFGHAIKRSELVSILERIAEDDIHWIIDEAFVDLTGNRDDFSAVSPMGDVSNVTIAGSLTKSWAVPGLRLGYLLSSNHEKLEAIREQQETWTHGSLTHYWAQTMLQPDRILVHLQQLTQIAAIRDAFFSEINASQFIRVYPSEVNYGVCKWTPGSEGPDLNAFFSFLNHQRIHVRECDSIPGMPVGRCFRVAVRKPEENERFLEAIHAFERENPFNKGSI